jgi:uncharacterized membrane protein
MTVDVSTEIVIRRPREDVAGYVADPGNAPEWYANIESVRWQTEPSMRVGSQIAFVARFLGRHLAYTDEVAVFAPGERLVMRTAQGPFPRETTYTWEATSAGHTRMTLRNRGAPAGLSTLAAPLVAVSIRRANRSDLARLKTLLEGRPSSSVAG